VTYAIEITSLVQFQNVISLPCTGAGRDGFFGKSKNRTFIWKCLL